MKKILAIILALTMLASFIACTGNTTDNNDDQNNGDSEEVKVMTHAEYEAAAVDSEVCVETYVQATQSWWDNQITAYCQSEDGAYFVYNMACAEADAAKLTPGTKIKVTGVKAVWEGEVEIIEGKFEIIEGADPYIAQPYDATALLGTDDLIKHQNELVVFKGVTIDAIEYKNGEPGDDIYLTVGYNGATYSFCVEVYLTGTDSEVYTTVGTLEVGTTVDIECFLYWYQSANPHVTSITPVVAG